MKSYITPIIIYNYFRLTFLKLISSGKLNFKLIQKLSSKSKLSISGGGELVLNGICTINSGTLIQAIGGKIIFEGNTFINRNCTIVSMESIIIGTGTSIGPNVCIYDHDHDYKKTNKDGSQFISSPITIGKNVWIGAGVIILRGAKIDDNSVVGAGTIVTGVIPENSVVKLKQELIIQGIL